MWHAIEQRSHLGFRFILMSIPIESVRPIFRHLSFANIVFNYISAKFFSIYFSCFCGEIYRAGTIIVVYFADIQNK